ncbi:PIN domain-containing protein [Alloacidobacterium sp.]|uniref:PIN domain-containing protein n=1 Tax=Alloacidobacterium sp. TaxID=2951999 RepID=UPI002D43787E|nr:PIN domain-containing protein [Alloacidobacterium sp.]HYK34855.1 PIN domain-containing protein [Alloacidobacterium sp.]
MILADANIWIDFFRGRKHELRKLLENNQIVMHPHLTAELALGSLHDRSLTLAKLDSMPQARVIDLRDVRRMVEALALYSKGIGLTDAHLIASCRVMPCTLLWTSDARLGKIAESLGIRANLP